MLNVQITNNVEWGQACFYIQKLYKRVHKIKFYHIHTDN